MSKLICPHCQSKDFGTDRVPQGVVAVTSCPGCSELVVRFCNKIIALDRDVLYEGTKDEKVSHLAEVIAEFMEEGIPNFEMLRSPQFHTEEDEEENDETDDFQDPQPISDDELKRFIDFDLNDLDNIDYFRKNFG